MPFAAPGFIPLGRHLYLCNRGSFNAANAPSGAIAGLERGRGRGVLDSKGPGTARGPHTYPKTSESCKSCHRSSNSNSN
jgi:hypothetical protein